MKIGIKNATLISMSEKRNRIEENIDIKIDGNKIIEIGKNISFQDVDKLIDATGKIVMPGLINTHSHVPMSIFRETVDGYSLQDWLTQKIWPMEDKLTNNDIYYASYLSFLEMIATGTTTINDMYFMTEDIIKAALDSKVRMQTTRTLMDDGKTNQGELRLKELEELLEKYNNKYENITWNIGIHGLYTTNREYIKKCIEFAKKRNLPIHMHFCENTKEVEDIKQIYRQNPIEVLLEEFKDTKIILAHGVKIEVEDIKKLKQIKDVSISHCPVSNLKLGCGIANISEMINEEINVSLGTDGQGSGSNLDLFEAMKYTALLQKGKQENAMLMPAYEALKMATINGAKALGLENKIGSIEEGKLADIIVLNLDNIIVKPINDLLSDIVYNVKGNNVETTIINGEIVMENKQLQIDNQNIYERCKKIIERIK